MTATVSAAVAAQVAFYGNGTRTLLGPKGWHCEGAVGADGSTSMTITPPGQAAPTGSPLPGYQAVTAYTGGGCVGCIATMACGLFPEAWKLFDTPGSSCPTTSPARELITRPIPRSAIFEDPPGVAGTGDPSGGRYRALGLLVFDPGTGGSGTDFPSALKITCTLPDAMAQVATRSWRGPASCRPPDARCAFRLARAERPVRSRVAARPAEVALPDVARAPLAADGIVRIERL